MTTRSRRFVPALLVWLGAAASLSASPILTLLPSGDQSGAPGTTVGWGFTIQNDTGYIEITSAQFCLNPFNPANFPACTDPTIGTFNDIISQYGNDIIVGPSMSVTESYEFDALAQTGVGDLTIDPAASVGDSNFGQIVLTYNLFDGDPNNGGNEIGTDLLLYTDAGVTVTAATGTPEPGTLGLLGMTLAGLISARRNLRRAG